MDNFAYNYSYGMEEDLMEFLAEFGFALIGIVAGIAVIISILGIVSYVFGSIGLHTIAKRRGIHHAWLAWIPVAKNWVLGCVSDQYQYVVKGKVKNKRKILLFSGIASMVVSSVTQSANIFVWRASIENPGLAGGLMLTVFGVLNFCLSIATLVFYYMALYDLYTSCVPANNVLYLVFSIIFRVTEPFFIFFSRKKDEGMPPRKEVPQAFIPDENLDGPELL